MNEQQKKAQPRHGEQSASAYEGQKPLDKLLEGRGLPAPAAPPLQVSRAPEPISPLTGVRSSPPPAPTYPKARWGMWSHVPDVALWEGVCLSVDAEPNFQLLHAREWPTWFKDRLSFSERFLRDGVTFKWVLPMEADHLCKVSLADFAALAVKLWGDGIPEQLRALASDVGRSVQAEQSSVVTPPALPIKETRAEAAVRRYDRYVTALGGGFDEDGKGGWRLNGGALDSLRAEETQAGRKRWTDVKTLSKHLKLEHERRLSDARGGLALEPGALAAQVAQGGWLSGGQSGIKRAK